MKKLFYVSLFIFASAATVLNAQDVLAEDEHQSDHLTEFSPHRIGVLMGYGFVYGAVDENGENTPLIIPVIALDYEYWFNHKIGLGLLNDLELTSYTMENEDQEYLERSYAFITSMIHYVLNFTIWKNSTYVFAVLF